MAVATAAAESARTTVRRRLLVIIAGAAAATAIWALATLFGAQLLVRFGSGAPQAVGLGYVLAGALIAPLLGWALLAFLERRTLRAGTVWTRIALVVLVVSFTLPLAAGITASTRATLMLMHVAVGSVVIAGLRRS